MGNPFHQLNSARCHQYIEPHTVISTETVLRRLLERKLNLHNHA